MTKGEILEFVKKSGLKPADIVAKSNGLIPITQAHDWLRTWKFSMSTLLLLEVYAKKKEGAAGIFSGGGIPPQSPMPEFFDGPKYPVSVDDEFRQTGSVKTVAGRTPPSADGAESKRVKPDGQKKAEKIPAKKLLNFTITTVSDHDAPTPPAKRTHTVLSDTGFQPWGHDRTYKFVGDVLKVNFGGKAYNARNVSRLADDFIIEGTPYPVSGFTNVG